MKITLKGVQREFERVSREQQKSIKQQHLVSALSLRSELRAATPLDTGEAREAWVLVQTPLGIDILNSTEYIDDLNRGSSKQAPSHFIERIALKYGKPLGNIVVHQQD
jgi:hypothetical protein